MKFKSVHLPSITDRGLWISDDRVNAFISSKCGGIGEIGYHGRQPVSRNSRMLQRAAGVFTFHLVPDSGEVENISFDEIEWNPGRIRMQQKMHSATVNIVMTAMHRCILIEVQSTAEVRSTFEIRFHRDALCTSVHGERQWSAMERIGNNLYLQSRDRIVLKDWIRRSGAYAGDFLIPEPWRRIIFKRPCRSGLASFDDVREEYRDADITLYDAEVFLRMTGTFELEMLDTQNRFITTLKPGKYSSFFLLEFHDVAFPETLLEPSANTSILNGMSVLKLAHALEREKRDLEVRYEEIEMEAPSLHLENYPATEAFFSEVPMLVESCIVRDYGMTRANPGAYYWMWAWDNIVTGIEMHRWGNIDSMKRMMDFINAHRDINGLIPGRWTRDLLPLDTPIRGAMEFLFAHLVLSYTMQSNDRQHLLSAYPFLVAHAHALQAASDAKALFANIGCYPDLPKNFDRKETSIVAMEIAAAYSFYRIVENCANMVGDGAIAADVKRAYSKMEECFLSSFWQEEKKNLFDSFDAIDGKRNESFPLFTFLFLQTPCGYSLLEEKLEEISSFFSQQYLTEHGVALTPQWDKNWRSESVTHAWYPHWDIYLVKILRRTGRTDDLMKWLSLVEKTLTHLGYCPEFLSLDGFIDHDGDPYRLHGAVSNLNCATGWYRALLEGIIGIEFDVGGMTIIPLALPLAEIRLSGLHEATSTWDVEIRNEGSVLSEILIDDSALRGSLKIPSRYNDHLHHTLHIRYGTEPFASRYFTRVINGEVLTVKEDHDDVAMQLHTHGKCELSFFSRERCILRIDGVETEYRWDAVKSIGKFEIHSPDLHLLQLIGVQ